MFRRLKELWAGPDPKLLEALQCLRDHAPQAPFVDDKAHDDWVKARANQMGMCVGDVEVLWSMIGSYTIRQTILKGARVVYGAETEEVFRAMRYLDHRRAATKA